MDLMQLSLLTDRHDREKLLQCLEISSKTKKE